MVPHYFCVLMTTQRRKWNSCYLSCNAYTFKPLFMVFVSVVFCQNMQAV